MKIAFIVPYPQAKAPSQRFRFEQQLDFLSENDIEYDFYPFLSENAFDNLYLSGKYISKAISIFFSFFRRFLLMFLLSEYDYIFIHREASPIGAPIFEWIIAKILKKKIIYDFDDAIWLPNTSKANKIVAKIKWHKKVNSICKWSYKISCGNDYLAEYAKQFNENVSVIPTTVDMQKVHNKTKNQNTKQIVIGWTGTHSTIEYLYKIEGLLIEKQKEHNFIFQVISNKDPFFEKLKYEYIEWQEETEIDDLLKFNIGIMPLEDNKWAKGKCGFKAIQYMSLGIPAIVSNVGVNNKIVENENGFLCSSEEDWKTAIDILCKNPNKRIKLGKKAQKKIKENYSTKSVEKKYLSLFNFSS